MLINYSRVSTNNILFLLQQRELSIRSLAIKTNIPVSTLSEGLKSKKGLSLNNLKRVADYFNCSLDTLVNTDFRTSLSETPADESCSHRQNLSTSEMHIINVYRHTDKLGKTCINNIISLASDRANISKK